MPVLRCLLPQLHHAVDVTLTRERGHVQRKARDSSHDGCRAVHVVGSQLGGEGQTIGERSLQWERSPFGEGAVHFRLTAEWQACDKGQQESQREVQRGIPGGTVVTPTHTAAWTRMPQYTHRAAVERPSQRFQGTAGQPSPGSEHLTDTQAHVSTEMSTNPDSIHATLTQPPYTTHIAPLFRSDIDVR